MAKELTPSERDMIRRFRPDPNGKCENCGNGPTVPISGLCGPCHFGTAAALNGGWWDETLNDFDDDFVKEYL